MTELNFLGTSAVYNHHLAVPYRPLTPDAKKSVGEVAMDGNLIIEGDNLHALKSLLPLYAGKVDCIFIDPPYNTGGEWAYDDNVNAPQIKEWLDANPVSIEDNLRHDKWCAMMWPRLRLLHELLSDTGSLWMTIDDNEVHRVRGLLDEIFGQDNFIANIIWQKKYTTANHAKGIPASHDHLLVFQKTEGFRRNLLPRTEKQDDLYKNDDGDGKGLWRTDNLLVKSFSAAMVYPIINPNTKKEYMPPNGKCWRANQNTMQRWLSENRIFFGKDGKGAPQLKRYLKEVKQGILANTWWPHELGGHNDESKKELQRIFSSATPFDTPKPVRLIERVFQIALGDGGGLILDSFAGSGTTAHAVLEANKKDGGNRKFILVEMENEIADAVSAERVRRVIKGYPFIGTSKTELLTKRLNHTALKKGAELALQIEELKQLEGDEYDKVKVEVKDNQLAITGENKVEEKMPGLGGSFTYCTLGKAFDLNSLLSGEDLPDYETLAPHVFCMATGQALNDSKMKESAFYLGETDKAHIWMIYKPDYDWLRSPDAALTKSFAEAVLKKDGKKNKQKKHLVLAASNYLRGAIAREGELSLVEHVPLPYALFHRESSIT